MAHWQASITRAPPKTKAELRQMLTEAVRNTQPGADRKPKHAPNTKKDQPDCRLSIGAAGTKRWGGPVIAKY